MADFDWAKYEDKQPASFDWSKYEDEPTYQPQESKGIGGVATDALGKMLQSVYGIPAGLMALPGEAYGAVNQLATNPKRAAQNFGAGFGELGHGVLSAPGNIRDYLAKKDLISQKSPSFRLPEEVLPKDYNYGEALGAEGNQPGDELIRGIPTGVASIPFANKLFSALEEIPVTRKIAAKPLKKAEQLIAERDIGKFSIPKDIFKETKDFLPNNTPYKKLLQQAKKGDYKDLFTLQSDLGMVSRELNKSASGAERLHGRQAGDLRKRLLDSMKEHLNKGGHEDISKLISKGQNKYRQHMKFKKPVQNAALIGLGALGLGSGYSKLKNLVP